MTDDFLRFAFVFGASCAVLGCTEEPELDYVPPVVEGPLSFPPPPDSPVAIADTWYADCGQGLVFAMGDVLPAIAEGMSHQRIPYGSPNEWRDCSGNFLRLSSYLASACPAGQDDLAAPPGIADYTADGPNVPDLDPRARSSRDLAQWFLDQGRFVPVWYDRKAPSNALSDSLEEYRYLLKPGAVLWFSRNRPAEADGVDQLFGRKDTRIVHVGTVVAVDLADDGTVIGYSMYHGGNPSRVGSVTDGHRISGAGGGPPFGNGGEYLVGIGTVLPLAPPP